MARLTSGELSEWLAYYSLEPFGQDRQDFGHAQTAAAIINAFKGKGPRVKAADLMPRFERSRSPAKRQQSTGDMQKIFRQAAGRWGKGKA